MIKNVTYINIVFLIFLKYKYLNIKHVFNERTFYSITYVDYILLNNNIDREVFENIVIEKLHNILCSMYIYINYFTFIDIHCLTYFN